MKVYFLLVLGSIDEKLIERGEIKIKRNTKHKKNSQVAIFKCFSKENIGVRP